MRSPHRGTLLIGTFLTASLLALFPEPAQTQQSEQPSAPDREILREQGVRISADGVKGDASEIEKAAEAVQSPAGHEVGKNEDRKTEQAAEPVGTKTEQAAEPVGTKTEQAAEPVGTKTEQAAEPVGTKTEQAAEPVGGGRKARADESPRKPKTGKPNKTPQNVAKNPWGKLSQNVQPKFECPWRDIPVWNLFCTDIRASTLAFGESMATAIATAAPNPAPGPSHHSIHGIFGKTGGPGNSGNMSAYGGAAGSAAAGAASAAAGAAGAAGAAATGAAGAAAGAAGGAGGAAGAAGGAAGAAGGAAGAAAGAAGAAAGGIGN
jgi:hypothetical protein